MKFHSIFTVKNIPNIPVYNFAFWLLIWKSAISNHFQVYDGFFFLAYFHKKNSIFSKIFFLQFLSSINLLWGHVRSRVSNASGFYLRTMVGPVISAQFRTIPRNRFPIGHPSELPQKCGPDRFSRFDVYRLQKQYQIDHIREITKQISIYKFGLSVCLSVCIQ